ILEISQDRLKEKGFLRSIGTATTEFRAVNGPAALTEALTALGTPAVLKTVRMGYDGKGQATIADPAKAGAAWRRMGGGLGILEAFVDFACEVSVIVARTAEGALAAYPPVENRHVS